MKEKQRRETEEQVLELLLLGAQAGTMVMSTTRHASEVGIFSGAVGGGRLE